MVPAIPSQEPQFFVVMAAGRPDNPQKSGNAHLKTQVKWRYSLLMTNNDIYF
jgi:hypothetical protein